ncbi:MAG: phenol hydroxylase subunit [Alcaligenes pakistanensis]
MSDTSLPTLTKYVRVRSSANARFVEFDFAIGQPDLFVELVLPPAAFEHFCLQNNVQLMSEEQMRVNDENEDKWRFGYDTLVGNNRKAEAQ